MSVRQLLSKYMAIYVLSRLYPEEEPDIRKWYGPLYGAWSPKFTRWINLATHTINRASKLKGTQERVL